MAQILLLVTVALVIGALVFGVAALATGNDPGLSPADPDGAARRLPGDRPLVETDVTGLRFDTGLRGYRMAQVDAALARIAYDMGYKHELIEALQAEVEALRAGRLEDAEVLRKAREAAVSGTGQTSGAPSSSGGILPPAPDAEPLIDLGEPEAEPAAERARDDEPKPAT